MYLYTFVRTTAYKRICDSLYVCMCVSVLMLVFLVLSPMSRDLTNIENLHQEWLLLPKLGSRLNQWRSRCPGVFANVLR